MDTAIADDLSTIPGTSDASNKKNPDASDTAASDSLEKASSDTLRISAANTLDLTALDVIDTTASDTPGKAPPETNDEAALKTLDVAPHTILPGASLGPAGRPSPKALNTIAANTLNHSVAGRSDARILQPIDTSVLDSPSKRSSWMTISLETPTPKSPPPDLNKPLPQPFAFKPAADPAPKDFSFLTNPPNYTKVQVGNLQSSIYQSSTLPSLISRGNFDAAADLLLRMLVSETSTADTPRILALFHQRLLVLCFCSKPDLAADEAGLLGDLADTFFLDGRTGAHILPWNLRLLATGLAGRPSESRAPDPRGAIIGYSDMAREARRQIRESVGEGRARWTARLADLGWRIGLQWLRAGDLALVREHLDSILVRDGAENPPIWWRLAMAALYLRIGGVASAKECLVVNGASALTDAGVLRALQLTVGWKLESAVTAWRKLRCESWGIGRAEQQVYEVYGAHCYRCLEEHAALHVSLWGAMLIVHETENTDLGCRNISIYLLRRLRLNDRCRKSCLIYILSKSYTNERSGLSKACPQFQIRGWISILIKCSTNHRTMRSMNQSRRVALFLHRSKGRATRACFPGQAGILCHLRLLCFGFFPSSIR